MQFYGDENFAFRTIKELRNLGHDILTAFEDSKANQRIPDEEVLARAIELERCVLTHNRSDFKRLHGHYPNHFGIVICTENQDRLELARLISEKVSEFENLKGELIRIHRSDK